MLDLIFLGVIVAFFAVAVLFVKACERIIGPDVETSRLDSNADDRPAAA